MGTHQKYVIGLGHANIKAGCELPSSKKLSDRWTGARVHCLEKSQIKIRHISERASN